MTGQEITSLLGVGSESEENQNSSGLESGLGDGVKAERGQMVLGERLVKGRGKDGALGQSEGGFGVSWGVGEIREKTGEKLTGGKIMFRRKIEPPFENEE